MDLQFLGSVELLETDRIPQRQVVEDEIAGVAELAADGQLAEHRVNGVLVVKSNGRSLEVLDELSGAEDFAGQAELLLDRIPRSDRRLRLVGTVEVPGVEPGKVLQSPENLIATNCRIVRQRIPMKTTVMETLVFTTVDTIDGMMECDPMRSWRMTTYA